MSTIAPVRDPRTQNRPRTQPSAGVRTVRRASPPMRLAGPPAGRVGQVRACSPVRSAPQADLGSAATVALMVAFTALVLAALVVAGTVLWHASSPIG